MLYDCLTLSISTYCLLKVRTGSRSSAAKLVLYDGLIYIIALTAVNIMNIFLYRGTDHSIQSSGVSLEYSVTWIMSQRIIVHVREARAEQPSVVMTQTPMHPAIPTALQLSKDTRHGRPIVSQDDTVNTEANDGIRVLVEQEVLANDKLGEDSIDKEMYSSSQSTWDREYAV
ncbi:hypothetical protein BGW80DRAFT_1456849 [Lactifluus volemus]|nr:hypothetical protein BGW80DRAFT_1456849 [Lactifluus volemus]